MIDKISDDILAIKLLYKVVSFSLYSAMIFSVCLAFLQAYSLSIELRVGTILVCGVNFALGGLSLKAAIAADKLKVKSDWESEKFTDLFYEGLKFFILDTFSFFK